MVVEWLHGTWTIWSEYVSYVVMHSSTQKMKFVALLVESSSAGMSALKPLLQETFWTLLEWAEYSCGYGVFTN